jgi:phosphoglycerate dehydrogenase-like enzyme
MCTLPTANVSDTDGFYVGPEPAPPLVEAVVAGGGRIVPPDKASGLIWWGGGPEQFHDVFRPTMRWVQLPNAGVEGWTDAGLIAAGPTFTSGAGCYADSVAEHALALMLAGAKRLHDLSRAHTWTSPAPSSLREATVAIIGCGGIGRALIELLAPFRCRVLAVTRSGRQIQGAALSTGPQGIPEILRQADYVVLGAPATEETRAIVGEPELRMMRPDSWLVNVARGSLVDTDALVLALGERWIGGAALDVVAPEPLPDNHPLWQEPRALITPHSANTEALLLAGLAQRVQRNTARFLAGTQLEGLVDPVAGY